MNRSGDDDALAPRLKKYQDFCISFLNSVILLTLGDGMCLRIARTPKVTITMQATSIRR